MSDLQGHNVVDVSKHGLKKTDVRVSTVVFMIFCLCAAGCYGIEEMIPECGPGLTLLMLMVLPFVWSTPLGLVAAELGSARPQEGGYYKWVQEALGEFWGFQAGWWRTVSIYIDNSLYVILVGGYAANQWNLSFFWEMVVKVIMILVFTYINIRGVKDVGMVSTILAIVVMVAFAMVAVCGFMNMQGSPFEPFTAAGVGAAADLGFGDWVYYIGMGICIGMWMYAGYESMSTLAGEVKDPMVIPKATLITVPLIMIVYILPTVAGLGSLDLAAATNMLGAETVNAAAEALEVEAGGWLCWGTEAGTIGYADVVTNYWGPVFGVFFVIVAILAQCSIYNTYITSGSRGFFALADDHLCPQVFVKCDKKHGVPYVSVLSIAVVNLLLCPMKFTVVIVVDVFLLVSAYVMIFISAMILRRKLPKEQYKFKIPGGYGVLCLICIVPCLIGIFSFFINGTEYFIGGMIGIVSGPIMYLLWKRQYGGLAKKDAKKFPLNPKTKLAMGDTKKMAFLFLILAVMGGVGYPWLMWFEGPWYGDWGAEYYLEEYGSGFFSNFYGMLNAILIAACVFALIAVLLFAISRKAEPSKAELEKMNAASEAAITEALAAEAAAMLADEEGGDAEPDSLH